MLSAQTAMMASPDEICAVTSSAYRSSALAVLVEINMSQSYMCVVLRKYGMPHLHELQSKISESCATGVDHSLTPEASLRTSL